MSDLRKLDLNLLQVFEAIYASGSISRAAQSMGLTQPTISNSLSRLRAALDDPLFIRSGRGVAPTARAEDLIVPIRRALGEISAAIQPDSDFDPATAQRQFNLHMFDTLEPIVVPHLVREAMSGPGVSFRLLLAPGSAVEDAVESGQADIGVSISPQNRPNIEWEAVCPLDLVVIARKGHPQISGTITEELYRSIGHVSLDQTLNVNANAQKIFISRTLKRRDIVKVSRPSAIPATVSTTDLIGLINLSCAEVLADSHQLQILTAPFELSSQVVHMIWHRSKTSDPAISWLKDQIRTALS